MTDVKYEEDQRLEAVWKPMKAIYCSDTQYRILQRILNEGASEAVGKLFKEPSHPNIAEVFKLHSDD